MKILITGGHVTPALAFIEYTLAHHPNAKLVYVARQFSQPKLKQVSIETDLLSQLPVTITTIQAAKWTDFLSWKLPLVAWQFLVSLWQAAVILVKQKPTVILGFGGYISVPVCLMGKIMGVPFVLHEQASIPGQANKLLARFAYAYLVNNATSCPKNLDCQVVGQPIRPELLTSKQHTPSWLPSPSKPILLVTGGNQGSQIINQTIKQILPQLTQNWLVVHQTGKSTSLHNYMQELSEAKTKLNKVQQQRYFAMEWISPADLAWLLKHARAAISRAGANTLAELEAFQLAAIIIPLPHAIQNEQHINATHYLKTNPGILLPQNQLTPTNLLNTLKKLPKAKQKANINQVKNHNQVVLSKIFASVQEASHAKKH